MPRPRSGRVLIADVGATKTALAVIPEPGDARSLEAVDRYATREWDELANLVRAYLEKHQLAIDEAVFGVPGPVVAGRARCTNVAWHISAEELRRELHLESVAVLTDVEATAAAVPALRPDDLATIDAGRPVEHGTIGVVAPGTGLGQAFLTWDGERYRAHPSEGGHTDFAPADELQCHLFTYLRERFPHVSYERVCSGSGVPNVYAFLRDTGRAGEPAWLAEQLRRADDATAVIFEDGMRPEGSPICRQTVALFVEILGAKVGNVALTLFATGGMYLAGGIPPRIVPLLREHAFLDVVRRKGRVADSALLEDLALHVVRRPKLALVGLAHAAARAHERRQE